MEPKRGPGARETRKRKVIDYAAFDEGLGRERASTVSRWVSRLGEGDFLGAETFVERMGTGHGFTQEWARKTGLRRPCIIADKAGLGLEVPAGKFGVRDVAKVVGERTPVQVMRSQDQSTVENWSLADWARYWDAPVREDTLNIISLEFSKTALAERIRSPTLVRQVDWIDNCFPDEYRARGEYPQTQYYCLMSAGGCYTDFHVDFGGTAVWYHVFRGKKVFYVIRPTAAHLAAYEDWICDADQDSTFFADVCARGGPSVCARVEVEEGETFFIPSGWIHAVHTPVDSLVFGGNFLPGLCTLDLQIAVYAIEQRTHVKADYRFPYFIASMYHGLAAALRRLDHDAAAEPLTPHEREGLDELVSACRIWAQNDASAVPEKQKGMVGLAASKVGYETPALLVDAVAARLARIPKARPKFTFKVSKPKPPPNDDAPTTSPRKIVIKPPAAASPKAAAAQTIDEMRDAAMRAFAQPVGASPRPAPARTIDETRDAATRAFAQPAKRAPPTSVDEARDAALRGAFGGGPAKQAKPAKPAKPASRPTKAKVPSTAKGRLLAKMGKKR